MKKRVLVTGGTGNLGSRLRQRLVERDYQVRVMSRRQPERGEAVGVEWAVAQLVSGGGIREAVEDVDVIVHTASSPFPKAVEIEGGRHLLAAAAEAAVEHFVYISIVGLEEIDFSYYDSKRRVEEMIADADLPYTIQRVTQFHRFVEQILETLAKLPVVPLPKGWRFQPISAADVADRLADIVDGGPSRRTPEIGGPEVLSLEKMLRTWMRAQDMSKPVLKVPIPGGLSRGFRSGHNLVPDHAVAGWTWSEYLGDRDPSRAARALEAGPA